jgi:C4-dicarboxylate-specific signal transduction histidine kinase
MLLELLKNSYRATVEFHRRMRRPEDELPRVEITIGRGEQDVSIRIRDQGGGIWPDQEKQVCCIM